MSETVPSTDPQHAHATCLRCQAPLTSAGVEHFRIGGTTGGWKLVWGELAELGEEMMPLEVFPCSSCGHVEFRLPGFGPPPDADDRWSRVWTSHDRQAP